MKKYFLLLATAIFLFSACEEINPTVTGSMPIDDNGGPDPVEDQKRQVIIEEFTGVKCVQCPAGSAAIKDLLSIHGTQLIAVSIHAGDFSDPYPNSMFDFGTPQGDQLLEYLPSVLGYPSASVNRKIFPGQFDLQLGQGDWAGFIASEKAIAPKVRINIEPIFDAGTRELSANVTLYVDEAITDPDVRLSIMITENDIQDLQITPASSTPKPDYIHSHALRGMLTSYDGEPITEPLSAGAKIEKTFTFTMPGGWKEENCEIVAIVSLNGASKDILQAHQVHIIE